MIYKWPITSKVQILNHSSEPSQVWKWDLQSMWPEALRFHLLFLSPSKLPLEPGYTYK